MRRLMIVVIACLSAIGLTTGVVVAQWPTTCVELNDIVEAHLGNEGNVGIYQRVFGDQAEQACQNDHREDVRSVFAWAIGGDEPAMQPAAQPAPPAPEPTPAPTPATEGIRIAPTRAEIEEAARNRGANGQKARLIAQSVIDTRTENVFVSGLHTGIEYGIDESLGNLLRADRAELLDVPGGIGFFETHKDKLGETRGTYYTYTVYPRVPYGTYDVALKWERNINRKGQPSNLSLTINEQRIVQGGESGANVDQFWSSTEAGEYQTTFEITFDWQYRLKVEVSGSDQIKYRLEILRRP